MNWKKFSRVFLACLRLQFSTVNRGGWVEPLREDWANGSILKRKWIYGHYDNFELSPNDAVQMESDWKESLAIEEMVEAGVENSVNSIEIINKNFMNNSVVFYLFLGLGLFFIVFWLMGSVGVITNITRIGFVVWAQLTLASIQAFMSAIDVWYWNNRLVKSLLVIESKMVKEVETAARIQNIEDAASLRKIVNIDQIETQVKQKQVAL